MKHECDMGEFACDDPSQCFEPCGELGNDEDHVEICDDEDVLSTVRGIVKELFNSR